MPAINQIVENLVTCLSQLIKAACSVIVNKSSFSRSEANKMLESVCEFSQKSKNQQSSQSPVNAQLLDVESRLKQKFHHVSKLEHSLAQLVPDNQSD